MKKLRKYQTESIDAIFTALDQGKDKLLLVMATGLGKTVIAVKVADKFKSTLFIVDTEELAEQAAISFLREKYNDEFVDSVEKIGFVEFMRSGGKFPDDFKMGLIKADCFIPNGNVVIASAQTLTKRLHLLNKDLYQCLIIDEAHCFLSDQRFKAIDHFVPSLRLGLSATPVRLDGLLLSDLFEHTVYEYNILDGIKDGYLVEMDAIRIKTNVSLDKVKSSGGDLHQTDLSNAVNTPVRNNIIADSYLKYCKGRQAIGYAVDIEHAVALYEAFKAKGINADVISSNEEITGNRKEKWKKYKDGLTDVIFNVGILTKGVDHPPTSCLILGRPTKSLALLMQKIGRGSRTLKGVIDGLEDKHDRIIAIKDSKKKDCIILDITDNTTRHNIINCFEIDKASIPDEKIFITQEKRDKLNEARERKTILTHTQEADERIKLLALPSLKISKSFKMSEDATPLQLATIKKWGYPTDVHYSKTQIAEIFGKQPVHPNCIYELKSWGYDVEGKFISIAEHQLAKKEHEARIAAKKYKKMKP